MDKKSLGRFIIAILTGLNTVLTAFGKPVIPDDLINSIVIVSGYLFEIYTMYRNNYLTKKGLKQKEVLRQKGLTK